MSSRLALGTVQFGLRYGIANEVGRSIATRPRAILALHAPAGSRHARHRHRLWRERTASRGDRRRRLASRFEAAGGSGGLRGCGGAGCASRVDGSLAAARRSASCTGCCCISPQRSSRRPAARALHRALLASQARSGKSRRKIGVFDLRSCRSSTALAVDASARPRAGAVQHGRSATRQLRAG